MIFAARVAAMIFAAWQRAVADSPRYYSRLARITAKVLSPMNTAASLRRLTLRAAAAK